MAFGDDMIVRVSTWMNGVMVVIDERLNIDESALALGSPGMWCTLQQLCRHREDSISNSAFKWHRQITDIK